MSHPRSLASTTTSPGVAKLSSMTLWSWNSLDGSIVTYSLSCRIRPVTSLGHATGSRSHETFVLLVLLISILPVYAEDDFKMNECLMRSTFKPTGDGAGQAVQGAI